MDYIATEIPGFTGAIVRPDDPEYDTSRAVRNAFHDRRPALIAHCASVQEVVGAHARTLRRLQAIKAIAPVPA